MPEWLLSRRKDTATTTTALKPYTPPPLTVMKGHRVPPPRSTQHTSVTEIAEYLSLFRRQPLAICGPIYCKVSKFFRSRKHYAELRGCNMVIYRTAEVAALAKPANDAILAVLLLSDFNVEILQSNETHARIFIHATVRDSFQSLFVKVRSGSLELEQWRMHLSRARAVQLPSLYTLTVESIIGQGGGGKVFMVRWNMDERYYALKVINKNKAFLSARAIRHVASERYLMEKVGPHPFLLRMEFAFQTQTNLFIGTPLCAGGDLATYIRKHGLKMTAERSALYAPECVVDGKDGKKRKKYYGRLPEEMTRTIAGEIMLGLRHLHEKGIVYRDLKPENVLIDGSGHVKIGDFGLAKHLHMNHTGSGYLRTGSICGTRNYLPPEMLYGKPYSQEADMWSFGVMLYRVLCGCFPFDASRTKDVFKLVRHEHPILPSVLTPEARSLLGKLLAKDPETRLTIHQAMEHPFFASLDFDKMMNLQSEPSLIINTSTNPMDALDNFEISRLQGVTVGEVLCDSQQVETGNDDEDTPPMSPKGRLIGFEYLVHDDEDDDGKIELQPIEVAKKSGIFARIVSIDSDALLSPRRASNHSALSHATFL